MKNQGFSLVEACIGLIILGLAMGPVIAKYNTDMLRDQMDLTDKNESSVKAAMESYFLANGRYPCPADIRLGEGDAGYGLAVPSVAGVCTPPAPVATGSCAGICRAAANPALAGTIAMGGVPFQDLKITADTTYDGWKNKLSYAVNEAMTSVATMTDQGNLFVETITVTAGAENINALTPAHYILISHGSTGVGAFSNAGVPVDDNGLIDPATGTAARYCPVSATLDNRNCDNDGNFFSSKFRAQSRGENRFYDDRVLVVSTLPSTTWNPAPGVNGKTIANKTVGVGTDRVGFRLDAAGNEIINAGTGEPEMVDQTMGWDVNGNIRADSTKTNSLCDISGENCFSPLALAGTGRIDCSFGGDRALSGIAEGQGRCASGINVGATGTCPANQVVISIVGGVVQCATPP